MNKCVRCGEVVKLYFDDKPSKFCANCACDNIITRLSYITSKEYSDKVGLSVHTIKVLLGIKTDETTA